MDPSIRIQGPVPRRQKWPTQKEENACFEQLGFLSDGLESFLELGMSFMETYEEIHADSTLQL